MKIRNLILAILSLSFSISYGQIPDFESNVVVENVFSEQLLKFSKNKDFVIAFSNPSYWNGYENRYQVLSLTKKKWAIWQYGQQNSISNGTFNLVKKISNKNALEIIETLDKYDFWNISQDSLKYKTQKPLIADPSTFTFDFITKKRRKQLQNNSDYKNFSIASSKFMNWWSEMVESKK